MTLAMGRDTNAYLDGLLGLHGGCHRGGFLFPGRRLVLECVQPEYEDLAIPPGRPAFSAPDGSLYKVAPSEQSVWRDMVVVPPAVAGNPGYAIIQARFGRPGTYLWYGHILSHEDYMMMRPFQMVPRGN